MNTTPLFCYGSLMDLDVLRLVIGPENGNETDTIHSEPARLTGYRCVQLPEESFPILQVDSTACCNGLLISGLSELAFAKIRFFEGDEYELEVCEVQVDDTARTALYCADTTNPETVLGAWSLSEWQVIYKEAFCQRVTAYMELFGTMSATEADKHWLATEYLEHEAKKLHEAERVA